MSEIYQQWLGRVTGLLRAPTLAKEQQLNLAIAQEKEHYDALQGNTASLRQEIDELEATVAEMQKGNSRLSQEVAEAEQNCLLTLQALTAELLARCDDIIARNQLAQHHEIVDRAGVFLRFNLHEKSPNELKQLIARSELPGNFRHRLAEAVKRAHEQVVGLRATLDEDRSLQQTLASDTDAIENARLKLRNGHQVQEDVIQSLLNSDQRNSRQALMDFMEARFADARMERTWGLPEDVFEKMDTI